MRGSFRSLSSLQTKKETVVRCRARSRQPTQQVRGRGQDIADCRQREAPARGSGEQGTSAEEGARLVLPGEAPGQMFFPF